MVSPSVPSPVAGPPWQLISFVYGAAENNPEEKSGLQLGWLFIQHTRGQPHPDSPRLISSSFMENPIRRSFPVGRCRAPACLAHSDRIRAYPGCCPVGRPPTSRARREHGLCMISPFFCLTPLCHTDFLFFFPKASCLLV